MSNVAGIGIICINRGNKFLCCGPKNKKGKNYASKKKIFHSVNLTGNIGRQKRFKIAPSPGINIPLQ